MHAVFDGPVSAHRLVDPFRVSGQAVHVVAPLQRNAAVDLAGVLAAVQIRRYPEAQG
jgi:hypothetical protein